MIKFEAGQLMESPCVIFVANRGYALTSSRGSLIQRFLSAAWIVVVATTNDPESQSLCDLGAHLEPVCFNRGGVAPVADVRAWRRMSQIYRKWQPVLIHQFHAKPVIFGSLAARGATRGACQVVNTITGLGHAFISSGVSAGLAGLGYRFALSDTACTTFQNRDDRALFLKRGWVSESQAKLITGSGVDIRKFIVADRRGHDSSAPTVVMLGRLLRQKGIPQFAEAARRVRRRWPAARFLLAGELDPDHPDAVTEEWLREQEGIEYLGRLTDVVPVLEQADLFLFPSYYREGVPRVILEASATGLPTVGFDVPGVREAVRDGETGYLVPDRDLDALTDRVEELLIDESLRLAMGRAARQLAVESFDVRAIEAQYLQIYRDLGLDIE